MTTPTFSASDVARFLRNNPDFFTDHASLFAELRVPHPHQASAISLGERQILTLRARTRELEWQLSGLIHNATGNERISKLLIDWCAGLLAADEARQLPDIMQAGLKQLFDLPDVALRLWDLPGLDPDSAWAKPVNEDLRAQAGAMQGPYCGPAADQPAAQWLDSPAVSLALLPLTAGTPARVVGLLVLGSPDPERFTTDMGTDFLQTICHLAGAALSRLAGPTGDADS